MCMCVYVYVMTVMATYFAFLLAESWFPAAGVAAVFCLGLIINPYCRQPGRSFIKQLWRFNALLATTGIFLLVGVTVTTHMFSARWLAMLVGIMAAAIARSISIYGGLSLLSMTRLITPIRSSTQTIITWGGMRGEIAIALAFSIPTSLSYWWTIQAIAFGVVLFNLIIQAPLLSWWISLGKPTQRKAMSGG